MYFRRHIEMQVLLVLLSGVFVYWICRPGMLLFQWFGAGESTGNTSGFFRILNNYYGDLAWVAALCLTTVCLTKRKLAGTGSVSLLFSLPFLSELLQYVQIIPGVFDWFDIIIYSTVTGLFLIRFQKHLSWKK
jgi:hypothetical protein